MAESSKPDWRDTVRGWYHEGMRRRFLVEKPPVRPLDVPLLFAIGAALLAPWLAVVIVIIALATGHQVRFENPSLAGADDLLPAPAPVPVPPAASAASGGAPPQPTDAPPDPAAPTPPD